MLSSKYFCPQFFRSFRSGRCLILNFQVLLPLTFVFWLHSVFFGTMLLYICQMFFLSCKMFCVRTIPCWITNGWIEEFTLYGVHERFRSCSETFYSLNRFFLCSRIVLLVSSFCCYYHISLLFCHYNCSLSFPFRLFIILFVCCPFWGMIFQINDSSAMIFSKKHFFWIPVGLRYKSYGVSVADFFQTQSPEIPVYFSFR